MNKAEAASSPWNWLQTVSGSAALFVGVLLLVAAIDLILDVWLSPFQNNWLAVIFQLHAGVGGVHIDLLYGLNVLDIAILALVGVMYLGLYAALRTSSNIWSAIALAQPILGLVLFILTRTAGRSTVMGAGLVISIVMLRSNTYSKLTAYVGLLASVLLLVGDVTVGIPQSNIIAGLFGVGYVLLTTWFFLVAARLFQLGHVERRKLG
jgi:hypothetical protein